jgi:predicted metal-dependent phosphotriesterase family hydrolase
MHIMTVEGPVRQQDVGFTLSHEHVLCDLWPILNSYDGILDDEDMAVLELESFRKAEGRTLVEVSSIGLGRNPSGLRRIAQRTGVQIVMGSAWYRERVYPLYVNELSPDDLAARIVQDLAVGADGTDIRAGVIGEIGTERYYITPAQERVFRAAARAHKLTGVSIWTHTTHFGELALEQIALLQEEGVPPERIVISHLGDRFGASHVRRIAEKGVYLGIDNIGYRGDGYPADEVRARNVLELVDDGFEKQLLLSLDVCLKQHLHSYGGKGYDHLQREFLPLLRKIGLAENSIQQMTIHNPARALAYEERSLRSSATTESGDQ